jgi:hypothetical protein
MGWFAVLVVILSLLGQDQTPGNILLVSIALVSTIRATAYYNEDLSRDLAKMLPFAVLGLFLVSKSNLSLDISSGALNELDDHWRVIVYYLGFAVVLEFVLRVVYGIVGRFSHRSDATLEQSEIPERAWFWPISRTTGDASLAGRSAAIAGRAKARGVRFSGVPWGRSPQ